jgi:hypothetical protein
VKHSISPKEAARLFNYDPVSGKLFWKVATGKRSFGEAGNKGKHGVRVRVYGRHYMAHRIAFAIFYGRWPVELIDHINGDPLDNRIQNLREASHAQNMANRKKKNGAQSPFLGVEKHHDKWRAACRKDGKSHRSGVFLCHAEAAREYDKMAVALHGAFARPNFPALVGETK